jgi:hypothetical protein
MWTSNSVITLLMNNSFCIHRMELLVVTTETVTFATAIAMGAAEDEIDENSCKCGDCM